MAEETKRGGVPQEKLLELRHIRKVFNAGTVSEMEVFHDFSLTIHKGEFISVVGSNGSGKTTTLNLLCGSLTPDAGQILLHGKAAHVDNTSQLVLIQDLKRPFGRFFAFFRHAVKGQAKRFVKQLGEPDRKSPVLRDNANLVLLKSIAKQQNTVGFGPGAALPLKRRTAQLRLGFAGK